jgi:FkbM family methyltransferase
MIINKDYILSRICLLLEENQQEQERQKDINFLQKIWRQFQSLIPQNISIYYGGMYKTYKDYKWQHKKNNIFLPSAWIDKDFVRYCLEQELNFDTGNYYPPELDTYIQKHIDDRIRLALRGYISRPVSQVEYDFNQLEKEIMNNTKKVSGFYKLTYNAKHYYTPYIPYYFSPYLWIYFYGLKELPTTVKSYIAGKDFLDVGAFWGDSALMLLEFSPQKIWAYEPVSDNYKYLLQTIEKNDVKGQIIPINKGLGDKETTLKIDSNESSSTFLNAVPSGIKTEEIPVTTIDMECKDKTIGIIKMDIEGFEYYALKGALETIKRDKPVLLISIYHTGKDFFEIPPMIKSCVPEYKFTIADTYPTSIFEKILVAYVE